MLVFVAFVQLMYVSASVSQMSLVREWESMDLADGWQGTWGRCLDQYDEEDTSLGKDYWLLYVNNDRLFIAFCPLTPFCLLSYHNLSDTSKLLLLQPYPSWDAYSCKHRDRQIHKVVELHADRCDRLWVIDEVDTHHSNIIVFDQNTDRILRQHTFLQSIIASFYNNYNMAIDDDDCENPYLYIGDSRQGGIWTYSWAEDTMWHHPGDIVTRMIIAPKYKSDYSIVYYNKNNLESVWYIPTRHLRDKTSNLSEFEHREGYSVSLDNTALDVKSNVLFVNTFENSISAYPCWNRYEWCDPSESYDIAINTTHHVNHIKVDKNGNLWALTSRPKFEDNQINFSIFSVAITSANPATSTTVQASVSYALSDDYDRISKCTTVTKDTIASKPNSDITIQHTGKRR